VRIHLKKKDDNEAFRRKKRDRERIYLKEGKEVFVTKEGEKEMYLKERREQNVRKGEENNLFKTKEIEIERCRKGVKCI
jgi:hypothetical protein